MDYDNNIGYFMELYFRFYSDSLEKHKKGNKLKIQKYFLSFFRRWYYSALIEDTLLSPANFVSEINKIHNRKIFPQPFIGKRQGSSQITENVLMMTYLVEDHPVVGDLKAFVEHCMPDIKVDEDLFITEKDVSLVLNKVSLLDPFYVEYLNLVAVNLGILTEAPSIHSHHARVSEEYEKLYSLPNKEIFFKIYEATAEVAASHINQVIPLNKGVIDADSILELIQNPITTDALFEKIYSSLGIDIAEFFDLDESNFLDFDDEDGFDEFYHMVMSSTFFLGIIIDKYFHTPFGFYLKIITPEFLIPYDLEEDIDFFIEVINEGGDIDTTLFSPCTYFHLTELGKIVTNSKGVNPRGDGVPGPFDGNLKFERALKMIQIVHGDEEANDAEVRSIVSDIFGMPDIDDVYEIKISIMSDRKYWKAMEIIPINPLKVLFAEICSAFGVRGTNDYCFYMSGQEDVFSRYTPYDRKKNSSKTTDDNLADLNLPIGHKFLLVIEGESPLKFEIEIKAIKKYNHKKAYPNILRIGQVFKNIEE
ncbi:MAG: hypothetical protein FWE29_00230 [Defluviitaleaceae bacterium]|nr:hypothetical protein [Defluviitaleaceae bacterium]